MTRLGALGVIAIVVLLLSLSGQAKTQTPQTVFRTNTDLVTVPVFVKGSDGRLGSLRADDFQLTDNGVPQKVETVDGESIPIDVTVLIETGKAIENYRKSINDQVERIAAMMRPTDRIEVLGIDSYVTVLVPFGPPTRSLSVSEFAGGGMTSVDDALVAALLREPDSDHRHLIIAVTDTIDTMSTVTMARVRDVAKQSSATLVVSWITLSRDGDGDLPPWLTSSERLDRHVKSPRTLGELPMLNIPSGLATPRSSAVIVGRTAPPRQQWTPHYDPQPGRNWNAFADLREAAEVTGGAVHPPGVFTDRSAAVIFDKIYAEFRSTYTLRYLPQGVARGGWHEVKVSIRSAPDAEVRARRGYFVSAPGAAPAEPAVAAASERVTPWSSLRDAMEHADLTHARAVMALAASSGKLGDLIDDFTDAGNVWPASPRREFLTALVLAEAAVSTDDPAIRSDVTRVLQREVKFVRPPTGADDFARDWVSAANLLTAASQAPAPSWRDDASAERRAFWALADKLAASLTPR